MYYFLECEEKEYTCKFCDKQFSHEDDLKKHLTSHTGKRPYTCDMCPKQFSRKSERIAHDHVHTGVKPYACYICSKQFARKGDRSAHFRVHTGEKPYACDICYKQFSQKGNLKKHIDFHTGKKSFSWTVHNKQQFTLKDLELKRCSCKVSKNLEISELKEILPLYYKYSPCECEKVENGFYCRFRVNIWTKKDALMWLKEFTVSSKVIYTKEKTFREDTTCNVFKTSLKCHHNTKPRGSQSHPKHSNCPSRLVMTVKKTGRSRNYQSKDVHLKDYPTVVVLLHLHNHLPDSAESVKLYTQSIKYDNKPKNKIKPENKLLSHQGDLINNESGEIQIEETEYIYPELPEEFTVNIEDNTVVFQNRSSEIVERLKTIFDEIASKVKKSTDIMVAAENFIESYNKISTEASLSSALNTFGPFS